VIIPFTPPEKPPIIRHLSGSEYGQKPLEIDSHRYHYVLTGNTLLPDIRIRDLIARASTPQGAVAAINDAYHQEGYFLVAIKAGVEGKQVNIQVIQGQITELQAPKGLRWYFSGVRNREDLSNDDLTYHSVLSNLYAQRNGYQMQLGLAPAQNPGGTALTVSQTPIPGYEPLSGSLIFGNYGSRYSSRYLTGGTLNYNPGWGINLNANFTQGLPSLTTASFGSQYETGGLGSSIVTPLGIYGFTSQWSHYKIGQSAAPLYPTGNIFTWSATGNQLLYASDKTRWSLNEAYTHVGYVSTVFSGLYTLVDQHYNYYSVGTQYNRGYSLLSKPGSATLSFTYNQGINGSHGTLFNDVPGYPVARFHYFDTSVSLSQALPWGFSASLNASGQGAFNFLPQQQQWVVGGFGNLSAYYPGVLVGDSGYSARFALQTPARSFYGFSAMANLFAEAAGTTYTQLAPQQAPWQSLSDVGIGITLQSPWGTTITALSALPVGHNNIPQTTLSQNRVVAYFVLQQSF
jgi:hemolysin activation/secretion protein